MQQLVERNTYTPTDTSLVCSNCDSELNRDENLSVQNLKTSTNNPEVNLSQHREKQNLRVSVKVYVLNQRGNPLMPCSPRKAKLLLKQGKAKVVKLYPFTIQLTHATGEVKQEIVLGIDLGYKNIGFSCVTKKQELIGGTVTLENDMSKRLLKRKMYRRCRRNRLWCRKPRFLNRGKKEWLAPSIKRRIDTHVNLVGRLKKILPISQVDIEVANFDIQKINNFSIKGEEYQQGNLYTYENVKAFILAREHGRCQLCNKEYDNNGWHLHHIILRNEGGTNKPDNLALLHEKCHDKLHKQKLFSKLKSPKQYKSETFMSIARRKILEGIKKICRNVNIIYGYETKVKRIKSHIEKTHSNDAFVIANGYAQNRSISFKVNQKRHNNRCLQLNRKGFKPSIRKSRSLIQPNDFFWVEDVKYVAKGMFNYGKHILYGDVKKKEYFKTEKIERYFNTNSWQFV